MIVGVGMLEWDQALERDQDIDMVAFTCTAGA